MPIATDSYSLSLKNACRQQWSAMSDQPDGKYCTQCAKSVIDFTGLSDQEIIQLLSRNTGNVCARVSQEQLNRNLLTSTPKSKRTGLAFFTGLFALLTFENGSAAVRRSAVNEKLYHVEDAASKLHAKTALNGASPTNNNKRIIKGKVMASNTSLPIAHASIWIKDTKVAAETDTMGLFTITVPVYMKAKHITLVVGYVGYAPVEKKINIKRFNFQEEFVLSPEENQLLGEVVIVQKRKKWWQFWK